MPAFAHLLAAAVTALSLHSPTTAGNRLLAHRDAEQLIQRVVLPADARRLRRSPGHAGGLLAHPPRAPAGELVDRRRLWRVDEPLGTVVAFVRAHRPQGASKGLAGYGSSGGPRVPENETLSYAFPALAGRISLRSLSITLVALPDGWTGVRADAQDIWVVTRPRTEAVPAGVREVDVRDAGRLAGRFTEPAQVAKIVRWLDALPIVQPGAAFSCPMLVYGPVVKLDLRSADGALLAQARMPMRFRDGSLVSTACTAIEFSIGGRRQTPLVGGRFLLRLEHLLGRRL